MISASAFRKRQTPRKTLEELVYSLRLSADRPDLTLTARERCSLQRVSNHCILEIEIEDRMTGRQTGVLHQLLRVLLRPCSEGACPTTDPVTRGCSGMGASLAPGRLRKCRPG